MKGSIGKDMLIKLGLSIIAAGIIITIFGPILVDAGNQAQSCGAFRNWITDLSGGAAELC